MKVMHSRRNGILCPVCGGCAEDPHGQGIRCHGNTIDDRYIYCTREEYSGKAKFQDWAYLHFNDRCPCGIPHQSISDEDNLPKNIKSPPSNTAKIKYANSLWANTIPLSGTYGEQYFPNRGINFDKIPKDSIFHSLIDVEFVLNQIRFHPALEVPQLNLYCEGLVARVSDNNLVTKGVQVTYLDGWDKVPELDDPRRSFGAIKGNAIYLAPPTKVMGITEGIEDALAVQHLFGISTIAACGSTFLPYVELPSIVEEIHLFTDGDVAGAVASNKAKERYENLGLTVVNKQAPFSLNIKDWNDFLKTKIQEDLYE